MLKGTVPNCTSSLICSFLEDIRTKWPEMVGQTKTSSDMSEVGTAGKRWLRKITVTGFQFPLQSPSICKQGQWNRI